MMWSQKRDGPTKGPKKCLKPSSRHPSWFGSAIKGRQKSQPLQQTARANETPDSSLFSIVEGCMSFRHGINQVDENVDEMSMLCVVFANVFVIIIIILF